MAEKKRRQGTGSHQQVITPKPRAMPPQRPHSLSASPPTHAQHSPCPEPLAWHPGQCTPAHRTRPLSLIVSTDLQGNPQEIGGGHIAVPFPPPWNNPTGSFIARTTLTQTCQSSRPGATCVQRLDDSQGLQFTLVIALCCVLHRCTNQEIRR